MHIIETSGVCKSYGRTPVLTDISISVPRSAIFALLGPNGAGKTTFVKSLLDLTKPDSGTIRVAGRDHRDPACRHDLAYMPEKFSFFPYYTAENVLKFYGRMHGIDNADLPDRVEKALRRLGIEQVRRQRIKTLSKGQLQRLGIAGLVLSGASVLIFDEPFSGLDPIGIRELKQLFTELRAEGRTVFINSHILAEVEQIADQIAILDHGLCLAQGPLQQLTGTSSLEDFFYHTVKG